MNGKKKKKKKSYLLDEDSQQVNAVKDTRTLKKKTPRWIFFRSHETL